MRLTRMRLTWLWLRRVKTRLGLLIRPIRVGLTRQRLGGLRMIRQRLHLRRMGGGSVRLRGKVGSGPICAILRVAAGLDQRRSHAGLGQRGRRSVRAAGNFGGGNHLRIHVRHLVGGRRGERGSWLWLLLLLWVGKGRSPGRISGRRHSGGRHSSGGNSRRYSRGQSRGRNPTTGDPILERLGGTFPPPAAATAAATETLRLHVRQKIL